MCLCMWQTEEMIVIPVCPCSCMLYEFKHLSLSVINGIKNGIHYQLYKKKIGPVTVSRAGLCPSKKTIDFFWSKIFFCFFGQKIKKKYFFWFFGQNIFFWFLGKIFIIIFFLILEKKKFDARVLAPARTLSLAAN